MVDRFASVPWLRGAVVLFSLDPVGTGSPRPPVAGAPTSSLGRGTKPTAEDCSISQNPSTHIVRPPRPSVA